MPNVSVINSIELGENISCEAKGKGRYFASRFIEPGLAHYQEFGDVLITKETLDMFAQSMVGCPVIIKHKDIDDSNVDKERVGVVSKVWYEPADGWYWCDGILWDKQAIDLVKNCGWSVSCTYDFESDFKKGIYHGKPYDMEFTGGEFLHLALVDNPRYERANIVVNSKDIENQNDNHVPAGSPEGGQFAKKENKETNRNIKEYVAKLYPAIHTKKINDDKYIMRLPKGTEYQSEFDNFMNKKFKLYGTETEFDTDYVNITYTTKKDENQEKNKHQDVPDLTFTDDYNKIYKEFDKLNSGWQEQYKNKKDFTNKQIIGIKDGKYAILPLKDVNKYQLDDYAYTTESFKKFNIANNEGEQDMTVLSDLEAYIKGIVENACKKEEEKESKDSKEVENKEEVIEEEIKEDKEEEKEVENASKEEKEEKFEEEKEIAENKCKNEEDENKSVENSTDEEPANNSMEDVKKLAVGTGSEIENTAYVPHSVRIEMGNNY